MSTSKYPEIYEGMAQENIRQDSLWGENRTHPDGTGEQYRDAANTARELCDAATGHTTWRHILFEEVMEAFAESDPDLLAGELEQVGAVCAAWIADLKSRS